MTNQQPAPSARPATAPRARDFEVTMHRKACVNANQAARKRIAYVRAVSPDAAKQAAEAKPENSAFRAMSARPA